MKEKTEIEIVETVDAVKYVIGPFDFEWDGRYSTMDLRAGSNGLDRWAGMPDVLQQLVNYLTVATDGAVVYIIGQQGVGPGRSGYPAVKRADRITVTVSGSSGSNAERLFWGLKAIPKVLGAIREAFGWQEDDVDVVCERSFRVRTSLRRADQLEGLLAHFLRDHFGSGAAELTDTSVAAELRRRL